MDLISLKNKVTKLSNKRESLKTLIDSDTEKLESLKSELETVLESQRFVQGIAQVTQQNISYEVDDIVNLALKAVFGTMYKFHLDYELSRGKTEARFILTDSEGNQLDPMDSLGGGCVDVVAVSLRIALYALSNTNNVIVLDEPCRFLSEDLRERMSDIFKIISDKLNLQIIMVTHIPEFEKDAHVVRIKKENKKSKVIYG